MGQDDNQGSATQSGAFWDGRFHGDDYAYGTEPNSYLASQAHRLPESGTALVPGDGEGRNGVWLAEQGLEVTTLDLSAVAIDKAGKLAAQRGVSINAQQADLFDWNWPTDQFDCIASIYLHVRPELRTQLHANIVQALAPGGVLVIEGFTPLQLQHQSGGPKQVDMLYTEAMLRRDFAELSMVELSETATRLDEGRDHVGSAHVVRGVFRKA